MKAVYFEKHGDLDVLQYGDFPDPQVGIHDVLVRVKACALNHLDLWTREGLPNVKVPLPHILGNEIVGIVEEVGSCVQSVKKGDSVLVSPGQGCGKCKLCLEGNDSACEKYKVMGYQINGGYAEYAVAAEERIIPISNRLTFEEWVSTPLVFLTSWHMLITKAKLLPGETVLIHAAGSGIGISAIQIAKLAGARVITTASSEDKLEKAKALGADYVINYKTQDFVKEVKEITHGKGVEVVYEHIGPQTWEGSLKCLARQGRLVFCGSTTGPKVTMDLRFVFSRQYSILGTYLGSRHELITVLDLIEQKKFKPVVDSVFPLQEARKAQEKMMSRNIFGKIILKL